MTGELEPILKAIGGTAVKGRRQRTIYGITHDSRDVKPDWMFIALTGHKMDGHDFIPDAVSRGATIIVIEDKEPIPVGFKTSKGDEVTIVKVENGRRALGQAAAAFHGYPVRQLRMIGVTGTNGKTTTTYLIRALLQSAGRKVGLLGTIENAIGDQASRASHTTPESATIQEYLKRMVQEGVQDVVMEVSSHGLFLYRVSGCEFDVGVFTNLTQDHLDFHKEMEEYFRAKTFLFDYLRKNPENKLQKRAVINIDDEYGKRLIKMVGESLSFGLSREADISAEDIRSSRGGLAFTVKTPSGAFPVRSPLSGKYNVYNLLAAMGVGYCLGLKVGEIQAGIEGLSGVPGRFERLDSGRGFSVIVDYAHTEDALARLLQAVSELTSGRVITVFGCGGDRDPGKRAPMGRAAARFSDVVVITSDNPRSEDPVRIMDEVGVGVREGSAQTKRPVEWMAVPDRREAIERALGLAHPGDTVVVAGKGHEEYQIIGDRTIPFNDRQVAGDWIQRHGSGGRPRGS
ncbi:MAG: UDP-N-acetylmuramoyl-L-alanyl-D-glutamate--2,6-diaminopimelate ligase [Nitrospirota bacterium]